MRECLHAERDPLHQGLIVERAKLKPRGYQLDLASRLGKTQVVTNSTPLNQQVTALIMVMTCCHNHVCTTMHVCLQAHLNTAKVVGCMLFRNSSDVLHSTSQHSCGVQAGYYCNVCECILRDSQSYLDHINGKYHNRALGMSMVVEKSTADDVRKKFEELKKTKDDPAPVDTVLDGTLSLYCSVLTRFLVASLQEVTN